MSLYDYRISQRLAREDVPFDALLMAAMRKADSTNASVLRSTFPSLWDELQARYNAPGGALANESPWDTDVDVPQTSGGSDG